MKVASLFLDNGSISQDVVLLFDEMYLQKCNEYSGGETIGVSGDGKLYKSVVSFMIVGLKENIPCIIKAVPVIKLNSEWLKNEILHCIELLHDKKFNIRAVICDSHPFQCIYIFIFKIN